MALNVKLLQAARQDILDHPEGFSVDSSRTCIAYRICELAGLEVGDGVTTILATKLLGMKAQETHALFYNFDEFNGPGRNRYSDPQAAARTIDKFLAQYAPAPEVEAIVEEPELVGVL